MNDRELHALNQIDEPALFQCLRELVAIPSVTGSPAEVDAQRYVAARLREFGLSVDVWPLDFEALRRHPAYSAEFDREHGLGVVGSLGRGEGPTLILNGHVDVVPPGDPGGWQSPPWEASIRNGQVYGRGALDMKGALVCALMAAKALQDAGAQPRGRLLIQSVIGEEDGGAGTLAAVLRGYHAEGAIVLEPTNMVVAPAQAGALNFRIVVPGRSAHGALRPEGVSAIEKFFVLYQAIMRLEAKRNAVVEDVRFAAYDVPYPICIGTVRGGDWASSVADWLICEGRFGVAVGEDVAAARRALEQAVVAAAAADPWLRDHPPRLTWWGGQFDPAAIPSDHPLVETVRGASAAATGVRPDVAGMPYGADMRLLLNVGQTPTILFGPGDIRRAHRPNESVPIDQLLAVTRTLVVTALRFCEPA
jgi:acetylornithine deacetylase